MYSFFDSNISNSNLKNEKYQNKTKKKYKGRTADLETYSTKF